jgi:hypothetical protein
MRRLVVPAVLLLVPATSLAFVMSPWSILRKVATHREEMELTSLVVRGTFTFQGADANAAAAALKLVTAPELSASGSITYRMPGRCRVELDARGGPAPVATWVNGNVKVSGPTLQPLKAMAQYVCPVIANPSTEELSGILKARGIDTAEATLGRVNGVVSYVVGGRAKEGVPSFWVEKERFDPLRLIVKDGDAMEDVKLLDYSSPLAGEWHPRVVELRRGEELTRFVADKIETNSKLPDNLF